MLARIRAALAALFASARSKAAAAFAAVRARGAAFIAAHRTAFEVGAGVAAFALGAVLARACA